MPRWLIAILILAGLAGLGVFWLAGQAVARQAAEEAPTPAVIDPRALIADPAKHAGQTVILSGTAVQIDPVAQGSATWITLDARVRGQALTEPVLIEVEPAPSDTILRGDCYRVTAVVTGATTSIQPPSGGQSQTIALRASPAQVMPLAMVGGACPAP